MSYTQSEPLYPDYFDNLNLSLSSSTLDSSNGDELSSSQDSSANKSTNGSEISVVSKNDIDELEQERCLEHSNILPQYLSPNRQNSFEIISCQNPSYQHSQHHLLHQNNVQNHQRNFYHPPHFEQHQLLCQHPVFQNQQLQPNIQYQPLQPNPNNYNEHPQIINNHSIDQVINVILQIKAIIENNNNLNLSSSQAPLTNVVQNSLSTSQGTQTNFNQNCADTLADIRADIRADTFTHPKL
ncbi:19905_t:CDS:2, partial [Racocetra fulgida]